MRRDNVRKFRLQEKYKGLFMVDKDPGEETTYCSGTMYMMMVTNHLTQDWTKTAIDYVLMFREFDI